MAEQDDKSSPPVGRGKRFLKLAGMTASVAGGFARSRVRSLVGASNEDAEAEQRRQAGELIAQTLGELKGAVMKVGQIASQARDVLPAEIADALASLQNEAPPMPFPVIEEQIRREFGVAPDRLFAFFDPTPFAAASIGQVHRARTDDGREVVVKVQYPGVDASCDSDLQHLRLAFRASGLLKVDKRAMNELFDELRARIHEELDYCNEADNVRLFRDFHADDPKVVIPEVIGERSSQRVLTLSFEPGDRLDRVDHERYDQELRNELGRRVFTTFGRQIFELQSVHADPHPGNFAFRPDGSLVIYDFGCVKKIKPEIVEIYHQTIRSGIAGDWDQLDEALIHLGARIEGRPALGESFYRPWRDLFLEPFQGRTPYDFAASDLQKRIKPLVPGVLRHLDALKPPSETVFVDRVIGGHFHTMVGLGVKEDFRPLMDELLGLEP